jgi:LysM repeat protein
MESENYLISNNKSKTTSYGSLRKESTYNFVNIKHKLINGETLQGIALKYGVSVSTLRHLILRNFLKN